MAILYAPYGCTSGVWKLRVLFDYPRCLPPLEPAAANVARMRCSRRARSGRGWPWTKKRCLAVGPARFNSLRRFQPGHETRVDIADMAVVGSDQPFIHVVVLHARGSNPASFRLICMSRWAWFASREVVRKAWSVRQTSSAQVLEMGRRAELSVCGSSVQTRSPGPGVLVQV